VTGSVTIHQPQTRLYWLEPKDEGMPVDGQVVALAIRELRAMLPETGGLLAPFGRVVEATRTVVGVAGTGLTLSHEAYPPRWVATSDAARTIKTGGWRW
jgi:hypothetical protein